MSQFSVATFEEAVARYFGPIAREYGWPLTRRGNDAYEISSPHCTMNVSFFQGQHTKSVDVALIPAHGSADKPDPIGIWPIAGYSGVEYKYIPWEQTAEGFLEQAEHVAKMAKTFCVPYMLGQKSDWEAVRKYWRKESEKSLEKIKGYKFPPSVQKRWHLPPPPKDDSIK